MVKISQNAVTGEDWLNDVFNLSIRLLEPFIGRVGQIKWFVTPVVQNINLDEWLKKQIEFAVNEHLRRLKELSFVGENFGEPIVQSIVGSWRDARDIHGSCKIFLDELHNKTREYGDALLESNPLKETWRQNTKDKINSLFKKIKVVKRVPRGLTEDDKRGVATALGAAKRECRSIASSFVCGYRNPWEPLLTVYELGLWPIGFEKESSGTTNRNFYIFVPQRDSTQKLLKQKKAPLERPETITIQWIYKNCSARFWYIVAGILVTTFVLGFGAGTFYSEKLKPLWSNQDQKSKPSDDDNSHNKLIQPTPKSSAADG